ncbi:MAG: hypothetical protein HC836_48255 [Richelia sp. RM2_1_2]|nr:hypothetical protein [Richelia sp. RM1_1_1]NJO65605.1 hypothetical protein [Richelia sp. RM2_1_2]
MINENNLIGLTIDDATDYARRNGYELRVVQTDNAPYIIIEEQKVGGTKIINVAVINGRVSEVKS